MKTILLFLITSYCFLLNAQITYDGPADGSVQTGTTLNTNDFTFNSIVYSGHNFIEPEIKSEYQKINFPNLPAKNRNFYFLQTNSDDIQDSTVIFANFSGIPKTSYNPPDDYLAVGPNNIMMVVNSEFRIYDKQGNELKTISAYDWYSNLVGNDVPFDPKVIYDNFDNRWVMVWLYSDYVQLKSYYLISVSDDENPEGTWFNWALPADVNGSTSANNWADYEGVGFDDKAIYITSNQFLFSGFFDYEKLRIIDKANIYVNSNPGAVTWKDIWNITNPGNGSYASYLRPARMKSLNNDYYLFYMPSGGGNFCAVYNVQNSITNPTLTAAAYQITSFNQAPNAKQLGGDIAIEGGNCILRNEPVYQNGILYAVHAIRNHNNTELSSLHLLAVDLNNNFIKTDMEIGDNEHYFFYPALAVDKDSNIIISYSRSSVNEYAGGYFTIIPNQSGIPLNSTDIKRGNAYYYIDNGTGRNRWGDYSGAWIDPSDSSSFWICTEYVESLNTWGTWIGGVKYDRTLPVELTSFNIVNKNNKAVLTWKTASELNNLGFEINRGTDANNLKKVGFVEGAGTTNKKQIYTYEDKNLQNGTYYYQLKQIDLNGSEKVLAQTSIEINSVPGDYFLSQNYPNPFNPTTNIGFAISDFGYVSLKVYDVLGREVKTLVNENKKPGEYKVTFDGSNLPSGVYFYSLKAGNFYKVRKMLLIK